MNNFSEKKNAYIPIIGKTNVGKSTIFNKLINKKISITSSKKNTTQKNIIGIKTKKNNQYIYIDTPGFSKNKNQKKYIFLVIKNIKIYFNIKKINIIFFIIENFISFYEIILIKELEKTKIPLLLLINKIDKIKDKKKLLPLINKIKEKNKYIHTIFPISKYEKLNIYKKIENNIKIFLKKSNHIFNNKKKTTCSKSFIILEKIREKTIRLIGDEIPYFINFKLNKININKNFYEIHIYILIKKNQYKKILIGKKGKKIKKIIFLSSKSIKNYLKTKKKIKLFIIIKKNK